MGQWVIGDVHGCYSQLKNLVDLIKSEDSEVKLIFTGDLVDRGSKSKEVLDFVMESGSRCVLGNHDAFLLDYFDRGRGYGYTTCKRDYTNYHGGDTTLKSITSKYKKVDTQKYLDFIYQLPVQIIEGKFLIAHAPVDYKKWVENDRMVDDLWNRDPNVFQNEEGLINIHGHNPYKVPYITQFSIGIDTACVYGNFLSAYCLETGKILQVKGKPKK